MIPPDELAFEFADGFPGELFPGILYVSIPFATAAHLCCCGCGHQVVTPLRPNRWSVTFDGASLSLWPSVGNAGLPCRSHYVIRRNRVVWLQDLTRDETERAMQRDGWLDSTATQQTAQGKRRWWVALMVWRR